MPIIFFNSKVLTSFVPDEMDILGKIFGDFQMDLAEVIYPLPNDELLLTDIIYQHIFASLCKSRQRLKNIVLVDHGSPVPRVTEVRKHLAQTVRQIILGLSIRAGSYGSARRQRI